MDQQIPLSPQALAPSLTTNGVTEVAPDIAYQRLVLVNVVYIGPAGAPDRGWVLVDAGLIGMDPLIAATAEARFGHRSRPAAIVLTHGHFDHVGALLHLANRWDVPIYAHEAERPFLDGSRAYPPPDPTVGGGLMASVASLYPSDPINVSHRLQMLPADGSVPGLPGWRWLHTPGHTPGHISLWREADRVIIAGDAFISTRQESAYAVLTQTPELHGPPRYFTPDWDSARRSVEMLAQLQPELAVTGHGPSLRGPEMREALELLARDFDRIAVPEHGRYVAR